MRVLILLLASALLPCRLLGAEDPWADHMKKAASLLKEKNPVQALVAIQLALEGELSRLERRRSTTSYAELQKGLPPFNMPDPGMGALPGGPLLKARLGKLRSTGDWALHSTSLEQGLAGTPSDSLVRLLRSLESLGLCLPGSFSELGIPLEFEITDASLRLVWTLRRQVDPLSIQLLEDLAILGTVAEPFWRNGGLRLQWSPHDLQGRRTNHAKEAAQLVLDLRRSIRGDDHPEIKLVQEKFVESLEEQRQSILRSCNLDDMMVLGWAGEPLDPGKEPDRPARASSPAPAALDSLEELATRLQAPTGEASAREELSQALGQIAEEPTKWPPELTREPAASVVRLWLHAHAALHSRAPEVAEWHLWKVREVVLQLPGTLNKILRPGADSGR